MGVEGIFRDISERKTAREKIHRYISQIEYLSQKLLEFIELPRDTDIFKKIAGDLEELLPGSHILVSDCDGERGILTIRSIMPEKICVGIPAGAPGSHAAGPEIPIDPGIFPHLLSGEVFRVPISPHESSLSRIISQVEQESSVLSSRDNLFAIGLVCEGSLLGSVMILPETGKNLDREGCIQTYVRQASIALKRAVAENTLKKSEELFSNIAEHSPFAIAIIDPSGRYSYINQNFSRIFGYTLQDFQTGREWFLLAFPDSHYRKKVIADWKKDLGCTAVGVPRSRAYTVRCRDGGEKEIFFRSVLLSDGKQCIVYEDITERRDTERTRKLLASIVESTDDAIIGKTSQGFIISWNSAAERLYGYSRDEIIGRNISVIVPHEKLGELDEIMKKISRGTGFSNLLTRRIRKDGSVIDVGITISPIIEDDGRIIGVSTISRDITAEKAEERLRNSENKY